MNIHAKTSCPTLAMLKFLEVVLNDINKMSLEMKECLVELLSNFAQHIPNNLYEEVFTVFDLLLNLIHRFLNPSLLKHIIDKLLNKYTVKVNNSPIFIITRAKPKKVHYLTLFQLLSDTNHRILMLNCFFKLMKIKVYTFLN